MEAGRPSRTALGAARHRAAHQVLEQGRIFSDPLALRILGAEADAAVREAEAEPSRRRMRLFIAMRTRFAEDAISAAVRNGLGQLVVLGAGLDTFAYRNDFAGLRVFEVDHPSTQAWKRECLSDAGISMPPSLTFVPVDFERETLAERLVTAGIDPAQRTFFTWLGVVPYLTGEAVSGTLRYIAGLPGGADVVFDYGNPPAPGDAYSADREALAAKVAAVGEALRTEFETDDLHRRLEQLGFRIREDLGPKLLRQRWSRRPDETTSDRGGHVVHASTAS